MHRLLTPVLFVHNPEPWIGYQRLVSSALETYAGSIPTRPRSRKILVNVVVAVGVVCLAMVAWMEAWPFQQKAVVEDLREASDSQVRLQVTARIGLPASTPPCPAATESRVAAASVAAPGRSTAWGCAPLAMTRERLRLAPLPCLSDAQASVALLDMA